MFWVLEEGFAWRVFFIVHAFDVSIERRFLRVEFHVQKGLIGDDKVVGPIPNLIQPRVSLAPLFVAFELLVNWFYHTFLFLSCNLPVTLLAFFRFNIDQQLVICVWTLTSPHIFGSFDFVIFLVVIDLHLTEEEWEELVVYWRETLARNVLNISLFVFFDYENGGIVIV